MALLTGESDDPFADRANLIVYFFYENKYILEFFNDGYSLGEW